MRPERKRKSGRRGDVKILDNATVVTASVAVASKDFPGVVRDARYLMARSARSMGHLGAASDDLRAALPKAIVTGQGDRRQRGRHKANVNRLTKPRWYDRLLGYGLNGVVIYHDPLLFRPPSRTCAAHLLR